MKIIHDSVDSIHYCDIILSYDEVEKMLSGKMIEGQSIMNRNLTYIGIRVLKRKNYEINNWEEDDDREIE